MQPQVDIWWLDDAALVVSLTEVPEFDGWDSWLALKAEALMHAYGDRPATLVNIGGRTGRFVRSRQGDLRVMRRGTRWFGLADRYWIGWASRCTRPLLAAAAASSDFDIGELWITSVPPDEVARLDVLRAADNYSGWHPVAPPRTAEEVILASEDGLALVWLNPNRDRGTLVEVVAGIARSAGCSVHAIYPVPRTLPPRWVGGGRYELD